MRASLAIMSFAIGSMMVNEARSASFELSLSAAADSRYYDYYSDVYAQIDKGFNGDPVLDGFFLISSDQQVGGGYDVFPSEGDFANIGVISYDDTGLTNSGLESAAITALSLDIDTYIEPVAITGSDYTTNIDSFSGTVDLMDGAVSGVHLDSGLTLIFSTQLGDAPYSGTFTIDGSLFSLFVDDTVDSPFGSIRQAWDVSGNVDHLAAVPLPGGVVLLSSALAALGLIRRRASAPAGVPA